LQKHAVVVAVVLASLNCGCAGRSASLAQLDGSEPQRLSFGDPKTVQLNFAEKVRACWFGGSTPLLQGYRFDAVSLSHADDAPATDATTPHIRILSGEGQGAAVFDVEFHAFNDNTLISTRNLSLPFELASRLKRDVEVWIFGDKSCGGSGGHVVAAQTPPIDTAPASAIHLHAASWTGGQIASVASAPAGRSGQ
jgi:hypothetical protein